MLRFVAAETIRQHTPNSLLVDTASTYPEGDPGAREPTSVYAEIRENPRTEGDGQALRLVRYERGDESVEEARYRLVF